MIPVRATYDAAVVGGGVSGSSIVLALAHIAHAHFRLALFDPHAPGPGTAYDGQSELLLMNGSIKAMSVMPGDSRHLVDRLGNEPPHALIPRSRYGKYVSATVKAAFEQRPAFEHRATEIIDIEPRGTAFLLTASDGAHYLAANVVLALGNFAPDDSLLPAAIRKHGNYYGNPWRFDASEVRGDVAIIGSRLTAMDVVALLERNERCNRFFLVSRHGILPHPENTSIDGLDTGALKLQTGTPYELLRTLRLAAKTHVAGGGDWRAVVESLRAVTPAIWLGWSARERRRFLRHLQSFWAAHRYRVPPTTYEAWQRLRTGGRASIVRGRIVAATTTGGGKNVTMTVSHAGLESTVEAQAVVNATGPNADYSRIDHPLVRNLMRRGLIRPDELRLGIDATPELNVISRTGFAQQNLFSIGPPIRGLYYETTAVPEIVKQAQQIGAALCRPMQNLGAVS